MDSVSRSSMLTLGSLRTFSSSESQPSMPVAAGKASGGTEIRGLGATLVVEQGASGMSMLKVAGLLIAHEVDRDANAFAKTRRASFAATTVASSCLRAAARSGPCVPLRRSSCAITISPKSLNPDGTCSMPRSSHRTAWLAFDCCGVTMV